jgi:sugar diacid utilization regulator
MSITLTRLLQGPLGSALLLRVLPDDPQLITQVTLLEDFTLTEALRPGTIAVLSRASEVPAGGYALDVLVRQAVEREVAALVMRRATRRSMTAENLAARGGLALLDVRDDADPLQVLDWLGAAVSGDSRAVLAGLAAAAAYQPAATANEEEILRRLSDLSGVSLTRVESDTAIAVGTTIEVDGRPRGAVVAHELGDAAIVAEHIAAATIARVLMAHERTSLKPVRSASSALAQLLLCSRSNLAAVAERALEVGLQVHGWHCVVRVAVDMSQGTDDDAVPAQMEDEIVDLIARRPPEPRGAWTVARPDSTIALTRTTRSDPGRGSDEIMRRSLLELLDRLLVRHPDAHFRVGIATAHEGPSGLRTSAEEARIALASAWLSHDAVSIATFDSLGLRRMLAEWLATDTARDTVNDLLSPLDALGPQKAQVAIQTLHAYLDERGSLQRAAARLNVHRNAVVYRMAQISEALPSDLNDPDQRFALQLACRARLLTNTRGQTQ